MPQAEELPPEERSSGIKFKDSVQFRVALTFTLVGICLLGFTTIFIGRIVQNKVLEKSTQSVLEMGKTVVSQIGQELSATKQVTTYLLRSVDP